LIAIFKGEVMGRVLLAWVYFVSVIFSAQAAEVHAIPLGFLTIDITPQTWSQLQPDYRYKGKVGDMLKFGDVEDIYVLRCFIHVGGAEHIAYTVQNAIPPQAEFLVGNLPENLLRTKDKTLLTIMFKTRKGVTGLMNIYPGLTIVELNQRYGAVLNPQR
jgi:hypothetical protein